MTLTDRDNVLDCIAKGRHVSLSGEEHWASRLSADQVLEIRRLRLEGMPYTEIAPLFSISATTARDVVTRTWRHVA
jgi:hypothetical protein